MDKKKYNLYIILLSIGFCIAWNPILLKKNTQHNENEPLASQFSINSPKTINSSATIGGYAIIELNMTYNASYEAFTTAIFNLHFNIIDIQGIFTDLEFKYIQMNYGWMHLYSNLNEINAVGALGPHSEGEIGDILCGGVFYADTLSVDDAEVSYTLGFELSNGSIREMQQIVIESTGMTVDIIGNLEPELIEPGEDDAIWILIFPMRYWYDWMILILVVVAFIVLMKYLDIRSKKKKAFKEAQEQERLKKEKLKLEE